MITFRNLQLNLKAAGYDPGDIDGLWGKDTLAALMAYMASAKSITDKVRELAKELAAQLPKYQIRTPLRILHFLAQAAHECDRWRTLEEYWGPTLAQKKYEGREDLGNVHAGDGYRFRGRGIFQLTGRANYATYGQRLGLNLVTDPDLAGLPPTAVLIACTYWDDHGLNGFADTGYIRGITKIINGGFNGLEDREAILARGKMAWGI